MGFCSRPNTRSCAVSLLIACVNSTSKRIDFIFCDFTVPLGIDQEDHLRPPFPEQDGPAMSKLNDGSNVLSTYFLAGTTQSAFIHSFIHSFIYSSICFSCRPCSRLHTRLWRWEIDSPITHKSLCSVSMRSWPLFHSVPFFPKKTMLFWPLKRPPLLTQSLWEGSKPSLQVEYPGWNSLFGHLATY